MWLLFTAGPVLVLTAMYALHMLEAYQEARICSYLSHSGDANYMTAMLHKFNENILLWATVEKMWWEVCRNSIRITFSLIF